MKNIKVFLIIVFVLIIIITLAVNSFSGNTNKEGVLNPSDVPSVTLSDTNPEYTLAQVESRANASSCWSIVGSNVYDLTAWISSHPGGAEAILGICGKDATALFKAQHEGQEKPENKLAGFMIGTYKQ